MEHLNFHHLLLFTTVVREGSLVAAGRVLRLSHSTLSAQIRALEETLGVALVERKGRKLVPTEMGRVVVRYGEEIFGLGRELLDHVKGRAATAAASRLRLGVVDVVPKTVVRRLLEPLLAAGVRLVCVEADHAHVLARLALHELDVVISDTPAEPGATTIRLHAHVLGVTETSVFGAPSLAHLAHGFPRSLDGAPMLLPLETSPLRRSLNVWFSVHDIRPRVVGEFEDSALLKAVAQGGAGAFAAPSAVEREITKQHAVRVLGRLPDVREHFYAITSERRITDPSLQAIVAAARDVLSVSRSGRRR